MSFDINEYKLKHVISLKEGLIDGYRVSIDIEGSEYNFKIDEVKTEIVELIQFFKYGEVKSAKGSLEKKLKDFTYGKSYNDFNEHEIYEIRFSKFSEKIDGKTYDFEITGVGPTALKVSLYLRYDEIEKKETTLEKTLKEIILKEYSDLIKDNQNKLKEMKKEYDEEHQKQAKIREEVRREQAEKERKMRELEERLNSNKPKDNKPFKIY